MVIDWEQKMKQVLEDNIETEIKPKKFRNKKTGEIVTQIPLMEINNYEEMEC